MASFKARDLSDSDSDDNPNGLSITNEGDSSDDEQDNVGHAGFGSGEPAAKKLKVGGAPSGLYSDFASKMMQKMGYEEGKGLGKYGQGRADIVEASKQRGRRGLGLKLRGFETTSVEWQQEEVSADEHVDWLPECHQDIPSLQEMKDWMVIGKKKLTIDDETMFCDPDILTNVLNSKSVFDELEPEEMRRARTKSNPFETIRGGIFLNRAAMKMANMDAVLDFMFTSPKDEYGKLTVNPSELLYFADVCAGPGGFSEYVLWRKKADAKGFGFTLKGECDFKLTEFFTGPSENFEPHYGVGGVNGDGDIFRADNLVEFRNFVLENTDGNGVHFVMGDGGFSVEGQENIQEILSKQLYLCQFLCALSILRPGGHFVCKLFDVFTPFSVGLIYLMYRAFKKVTIFKPVTSRPANSERYIICKWLREGAETVHDYLFQVNQQLNKYGLASDEDVCEIVPRSLLFEEEFFMYILESNNLLGRVQALNLSKIQAFTQNTDLYEERQSEMRAQCLMKWKVPDEVRTAPSKPDPVTKFKELSKDSDPAYFNHVPMKLLKGTLDTIKSVFDYRCMLAGADQRWLLMSFGRTHIFKWDGRPGHKWQKLDNIKLELPSDTLIEVEFVQELRGEGKGQRRLMAAHITDVLVLYGIDVTQEHFNARMERAVKFAKAVTKTSRFDLAPLRVNNVFRFEEIGKIFQKLQYKVVKGSGGRPSLCYSCCESQYIVPKGIYFIKTVEEPWSMAFSRSQRRKYWYNMRTQQSTFNLPEGSCASVKSCILNRLFWEWEDGVHIHDSQPPGDSEKLSREDVERFVTSKVSF